VNQLRWAVGLLQIITGIDLDLALVVRRLDLSVIDCGWMWWCVACWVGTLSTNPISVISITSFWSGDWPSVRRCLCSMGLR